MRLICKQSCTTLKPLEKGNGLTVLSGILLIFMPKCALCWAAYMSVLSSIGIVIKYQSWFVPVAAVLFLATLAKLLISAIAKRNFISFALALSAGILLIIQRYDPGWDKSKLLSIALMAAAVLLDKFVIIYRRMPVKRMPS